jgi:hypothetical protein
MNGTARLQNGLQHIVHPQRGVIRSESNNLAAFRLQIASPIFIGSQALVMNRAVDLNDEPRRGSVKVGYVGADWCLPSEFEPGQLSSPQFEPDEGLQGCHLAPQLSGPFSPP